jgi:hypothetical protein
MRKNKKKYDIISKTKIHQSGIVTDEVLVDTAKIVGS